MENHNENIFLDEHNSPDKYQNFLSKKGTDIKIIFTYNNNLISQQDGNNKKESIVILINRTSLLKIYDITDLQNFGDYLSLNVQPSQITEKKYKDKIIELEKKKKEADSKIKGSLNISLFEYNEILNEIEKVEEEIESDKKLDSKNRQTYTARLTELKKFILSNKSHVFTKLRQIQEAITTDLYIISKIDPKFDKSYARLIQNYMQLDDLGKARYYADEMKVLFNEKIYKEKYGDIILQLEIQEDKSHANLKKFTLTSKKKEQEHINNENTKIKKRKSDRTWSILFSGLMMIASAGALIYLFKRRSKYI